MSYNKPTTHLDRMTQHIIDKMLSDKLDNDTMTRRMVKQMTDKIMINEDDDPLKAGTKDESSYWRDFETTCTMCGAVYTRSRGYMFVGMSPMGEMKTFCNVDCCNAWEADGDNMNDRKAAIMDQRAKKETNDEGLH